MPSLSVQPVSNADWVWLVKRLHKLCMELCNNYIQMHLDLENCMEEAPLFKSDPFFILPSFQSESSTPSAGGFSGKDTPSEDDRSQTRDHAGEPLSLRGTSGELLLLPPSPKVEKKDPSRKKEWWENAGNKIYTMAADKTISKLMTEYKKRKQQHNLPVFPKEGKVEKKGEALGARGQGSPLLQRPQHLMDQGQMRHSFSAGPELLRQEKRPRSGSTGSSRSVSARDAEAQIQVGPHSPEDAKGCARPCRKVARYQGSTCPPSGSIQTRPEPPVYPYETEILFSDNFRNSFYGL